MIITRITKAHLDQDNFYTGNSNFDGHVEIDENLGWVKFKTNFIAKGYILAKAGSGIKAGWGIEAGLMITAKTIQTTYRIFAGLCIWKNPTDAETEIRCEKLIQGTVAFGKLVVITTPKI